MPYMATFTINIPPMLVYIPYMDPMGIYKHYIIHQPEWFAHFGEKKNPHHPTTSRSEVQSDGYSML
jgi:hypothetical protein